jgi:PAS domain S-box-containing protein
MGDAGTIIREMDAWAEPNVLGDAQSCFRVLEALPAAIYVTDAAGRIVFFNQAAATFAGRTPEIGNNHWCVTWRLLWPDGRPMAHDECPMARALKENRPIRGGAAIAERPDGTRVPFMAYPTPLHDAAGTLVGAINMLVHLTDRERAEAAAQELNDTLEQRVEDRTRQLTETLTQLRESERRFRYLVEGVKDHAIFKALRTTRSSCWMARAMSPTGIRAPSGSKGTSTKKSSASIFPDFTRQRIDNEGCPAMR